MTAQPAPPLVPLWIELTEEEILADLSWPGPPPGEWQLPERPAPPREPASVTA